MGALVLAGTTLAQAPPRPDLAVTAVDRSPATVEAGASFSLRTAVTNRGARRAGASTVVFLLSANRRSDRRDIRLQGRRRVGALNPRRPSRFTRSLRVPAGTAARSYFLLACADGLRRVRERSERNNCRAASRRLAVTRPGASVPTPQPTPPAPPADTTAPATPSLTATDPASPSRTSTTPTLTGSSEPGSTVRIYTGLSCDTTSTPVATATASPSGALSAPVTVAPNSSTSFFATATDAAQNTSPCSLAPLVYVHDSLAPASPALASTDPASPSPDGTPSAVGTAEPGTTVRTYTDAACAGAPAGSGQAGAGGDFAIPTTVPADSATTIRATATDAAGNVSACSSPLAYVEDSTAPAAPAVVSTSPPSPSATDTTLQVTTTGEEGATLELFTAAGCAGSVADSGTVPGGGQLNFDATVPANQTTTFSARQTDAAGQVSPCSGPLAYTHDSAAPAAPSLTSTVPTSPGSDPTPNVRGTAESGSIVTLHKQAACAGPAAGSGPAASFADPGLTSTTVLSGQTTTFSATATDAAGNVSPCSTVNVTYFLDDDLPGAPTISGTDPASPSNAGAPLVEGTAGPDAAVAVFVGTVCTGTPAATTTADGSGDWSVATPVTANASNTLRAQQTDGAGNASPCSGPFTYVEDSVAPDAPAITSTLPASPSQEDQPTVTADGTPGLAVRVYATPCTGTPLGSGTADGGGDAVIALTTPLSEGTNNLRADTVDAAGNRSSCSDVFPYVLDTTAPAAPVLSETVPDSPSTDNTPGIRGTAAGAGSTAVALHASTSCGGAPVATGTPAQLAAAAGLAPPAQLNGTTVSYSATESDQAGNVSVCSNALAYTERRATIVVPEVEPNNDPTGVDAQGITFAEDHLVSGTFAADGGDVFKYRAAAAQLVRYELFSGGAEQCTADNTITGMFNGPFAPPADTTDLGIGPCAMWTTVLPPNVDIFPQITGTNPSDYLLEVRRIAIAGDESEPNDTAPTADPFPAGNDIAMEGTFGNTDHYTFTLDAPASVRIEITSQVAAAQSCEVGTLAASLQVQTAGGTILATDSTGGINSCAIVDGIGATPTDAGMTNLAAGTYTIVSAGTAGASYSLVLTKR